MLDGSCVAYDGFEARCSASHCSLIHPSWPVLVPSDVPTLAMMTAAVSAMRMPVMSMVCVDAVRLAGAGMIIPEVAEGVCAVMHTHCLAGAYSNRYRGSVCAPRAILTFLS